MRVTSPAASAYGARRSHAWHLFLWLGMLGLAMLAGCGQQILGAEEQIVTGKTVYQEHCARCHGDQGEGKRGPLLIGPRHGMRGYGTAQGLYNYTSQIMPFDAAGSLSSEEYWAVLAYLLDANGVALPQAALSAANAEQIPIDQP